MSDLDRDLLNNIGLSVKKLAFLLKKTPQAVNYRVRQDEDYFDNEILSAIFDYLRQNGGLNLSEATNRIRSFYPNFVYHSTGTLLAEIDPEFLEEYFGYTGDSLSSEFANVSEIWIMTSEPRELRKPKYANYVIKKMKKFDFEIKYFTTHSAARQLAKQFEPMVDGGKLAQKIRIVGSSCFGFFPHIVVLGPQTDREIGMVAVEDEIKFGLLPKRRVASITFEMVNHGFLIVAASENVADKTKTNSLNEYEPVRYDIVETTNE